VISDSSAAANENGQEKRESSLDLGPPAIMAPAFEKTREKVEPNET
jgi:hypothetical protein